MSDNKKHKVSWKKDERLQRILKQNAERRTEEWYKQNKGVDLAIMAVVGVVFIAGLFAIVAIGVAWFLLAIVGIIIAAFAVGSIFRW